MPLALLLFLFAPSDRIGGIEFFGYQGLDVAMIREGLPVHTGDIITGQTRAQIRRYVRTTDVNFVCCDANGQTWIYIGLGGENIEYLPKPSGQARLMPEIVRLNEKLDKAIEAAVKKGGDAPMEDDSAGYSLTHDPAARALELKVRDYALKHEDELLRVLSESNDDRQRAIAAETLGYGRQWPGQIGALVRAARDANGDVRNNATRALGVMAISSPRLATMIDPAPFIEMVRSGRWTDRNKAAFVLTGLTLSGNAEVLEAIRTHSMDALREMAAWHDDGHAGQARMILDRIDHLTKP